MAFKIIPQAIGHLRVDHLNGPFREFEERKQINGDVG